MSSESIFIGAGLIIVLAVSCQLIATKLGIPALILLLPVGFVAGILTDDVNPQRLLGDAFQPAVSLAVALILFDGGLDLRFSRLQGLGRLVVRRLLLLGVPITLAIGAVLGGLLLGLSTAAAVMLGTILVVSGPTVVGPLLGFVKPQRRVEQILRWEGTLIDPIGGVLGALVFSAIIASSHTFLGAVGQLLVSVAVGVAGAVVGFAVLYPIVRYGRFSMVQLITATLAVVVGVAAFCDALRDDTGLIAATLLGMALANLPGAEIRERRLAGQAMVQLMIGVLFVSISATITPSSVRDVLLPALGLSAGLIFVARPIVAAVTTARTSLSRGEREFVGWMAPRGIVAAATATTFSGQLVAAGIGGAGKILPTVFVVIVVTVTGYGLTAVPVAKAVGVAGEGGDRPLLVGGQAWVLDLGAALQRAGVRVLMWADREESRRAIEQAGLELAPGDFVANATGKGAELEGVTKVFFLTRQHDFNALGAAVIGEDRVTQAYRVAPAEDVSENVISPYMEEPVLFGEQLDIAELARRHHGGAGFVAAPSDRVPDGDLLFVVHPDRTLDPVTRDHLPEPTVGDTVIALNRCR
jgi:NhaP-type Na+/H+ or K+/H+ antiporter